MSAMGQIMLFPASPMRRAAPEPVEEVLLVGVGAELDLAAVPESLVRVVDGLALRYLAGWELDAAGLDPLDWVPLPLPSAAGRRVIAVTIDAEVIEQESDGALYGAGDVQVGAGSLISFCGARSQDEQRLVLGERAGWLVSRREDDSFVFSVHFSEPLLWIYEQPIALGPVGAFGGWMLAANELAAEADHTVNRYRGDSETSQTEVLETSG
jgi:hypothetical protein